MEVEDGSQGRTFFLAPVGAGVELSGPGGDGFLSVVTPASPVGKAVLGRRVGDTIEVVVQGEPLRVGDHVRRLTAPLITGRRRRFRIASWKSLALLRLGYG